VTTITTLRELERKATAGLWWHRKMHGQEVGFVERPVLDGEAYGVEILGDDNYPTLGARVARALSLGLKTYEADCRAAFLKTIYDINPPKGSNQWGLGHPLRACGQDARLRHRNF